METKRREESEMKFDEAFKEPLRFEPEGLYLSRRLYDKRTAAALFAKDRREYGGYYETVQSDLLEESWVRFGPTGEMEDELGKMAWMVCGGHERGAQPVWVYVP